MRYLLKMTLLFALAAGSSAVADDITRLESLSLLLEFTNRISQLSLNALSSLAELPNSSDSSEAVRHTNRNNTSPFRKESNSQLIQPLSLVLMALGLIGLGLATRIK
jgi:hypothetical protein